MNGAAWTVIAAQNKGRVLLNMGSKPYVSIKIDKNVDVFDYVGGLLKEYVALLNEGC